MQWITYGMDCPHCEGFAGSTVMDFTQPDIGPVKIDIGLSISQIELTCNVCTCLFSVGDLSLFSEHATCPSSEEAEEDVDADGYPR